MRGRGGRDGGVRERKRHGRGRSENRGDSREVKRNVERAKQMRRSKK